MNKAKKTFKISQENKKEVTTAFWMSKNPEERIEAVEIIREHYYSMLGYSRPPRIKKIIKFS